MRRPGAGVSCAIVVAAHAALTCAQPPAPRGATATLDAALDLLAAEARLIVAAGLDPPEEADFARRHPLALDPSAILEALGAPADRDPFVDAYVRFQLTSADPDPALLEERGLRRLLERAPRLLENPRADARVLAALRRAHGAGSLSKRQLQALRALAADLEARAQRAARLNGPAERFARWLESALQSRGHLGAEWALRRCAAAVSAGWPVAKLKAQVTAALQAAAADPGLEAAQRQQVAQAIRQLAGVERESVESITFMADGSVRAAFATSRISAEDAERWATILESP
jgi:hypothetical protein